MREAQIRFGTIFTRKTDTTPSLTLDTEDDNSPCVHAIYVRRIRDTFTAISKSGSCPIDTISTIEGQLGFNQVLQAVINNPHQRPLDHASRLKIKESLRLSSQKPPRKIRIGQ